MTKPEAEKQFDVLAGILKQQLNPQGFWSGKLSSSALATSVAIVALKVEDSQKNATAILSGLQWLIKNQNADGGFGDTPESKSNVSTSLLCYAGIFFCHPEDVKRKTVLKNLESYLQTQGIELAPDTITASLLAYYGKDLTFSVPILSMLVICGVLNAEACNRIPLLPFPLTLLPDALYRFFNLQVVSYAVPALVAVGIFIHKKRTRENVFLRYFREKTIPKAIRKLTKTVPDSGGFLEAIPLTAFVNMCLLSCDIKAGKVIEKGLIFLKNQQRSDGSWPIDTDLSTWVTTLSIKALAPNIENVFTPNQVTGLKEHLLNGQYTEPHPFNQASPGGWGWTNFSGSVPDADDTPGAILALLSLYEGTPKETTAVVNGARWLMGLQNSDGGFPTFCKGWGRLPFDSSSPDLTGHAIAAIFSACGKLNSALTLNDRHQFIKSAEKGLHYLSKVQQQDGSWLPLWFGSQETANQTNPVYGTAKVSIYLSDGLTEGYVPENQKGLMAQMLKKAFSFLQQQQNDDGSWGALKGCRPSIEETALAICALTRVDETASAKGLDWLFQTYKNQGLVSAPIGLYFATLWYDEALYPLIYYLDALNRFIGQKR